MVLFILLLIVVAIAGFPAYFFARWLHKTMENTNPNIAVLLGILCGLITFAVLFVGEVFVFFSIFPLRR